MRTISYREFKRRVFNEALQECLTKFTLKCCGGEEGSMDTTMDSSKYTEIATNMSKDFYNNLLNLNERTITETKKCMCEAVTFIQDCIAVSEAIAEEKANDAQEEHLEIPEDQDIELSKEDRKLSTLCTMIKSLLFRSMLFVMLLLELSWPKTERHRKLKMLSTLPMRRLRLMSRNIVRKKLKLP